MAHAWWHPVVGTTPLSEEEAWKGQGFDTAYTGAPDPGIESVAPELLLGGAGTLAAKGVMGAARPLWNVGKRALTTKSPVTGNTILRPAIQKGLSRARTSVVRPGYSGAPKKGAMIRGPKGELRRAKFAGEGAYSQRLGPAGYVAGGLGLGYAANKEEVDNMVSGMFSGDPAITKNVDDPVITNEIPVSEVEPKKEPTETKDAENLPIENPTNTPNLWKTWGSLADNPRQRKQAYLDSIKNIYMKKILLDGIANLTGGKSQGDTWAQMAIAELDAIEKFDSEERTHRKWKALFFNEDGTYNPPKNREEAIERGGKLDYDADEMKDILTVFPKDTSKDTAAMKNFKWYQNAEGEEKALIAALIGIDKVNEVESFSPSDIAGLAKSSEVMDNFSDDERSKIYDIVKRLIPGFTPPANITETSKTSAPQAAIDMLMSNPTPEMQKAFREKYGYLPEGL
jgi:hypothetical protein